jgi:hypothetical protein
MRWRSADKIHWMPSKRSALVLLTVAITCLDTFAQINNPQKPVLVGDWWQVANNPDLGAYTTEEQQPVDFGIWQAADGTWQLWSCIRHTKAGTNTRLFYRWEGQNLTDSHWKPMGIAMEADTTLGEQSGGLQAPYVFREGNTYYMFYGGWDRICLATSTDGKNFKRVVNNGTTQLFTGPYRNSRDAMVIKENGIYYCYYTGHTFADGSIEYHGQSVVQPYQAAIFCRTSDDKLHWSEPMMVSAGGAPENLDRWYGGDAECPFVVKKGNYYYLFRNIKYGRENLNYQYASKNPLNFGVGIDDYQAGTLPVAAPEIIYHDGQYYLAALNLDLDGIRISSLNWE